MGAFGTLYSNEKHGTCRVCEKALGPKNKTGLCLDHRRGSSLDANRKAAESRHTLKMLRRRRDLVASYKVSVGCADCGYCERAQALQFDHLPGTEKVAAPSRMWSAPLDRFLAEIAKCDVVCSNCHAVRTAERNSGEYGEAVRLDPEVAMKNLRSNW